MKLLAVLLPVALYVLTVQAYDEEFEKSWRKDMEFSGFLS
jgi:hypothetical protein